MNFIIAVSLSINFSQLSEFEGNAVSETGSVRGKVSGTFFHMIAEAD